MTAAFLACKVEEFNVTMDQFLHNIKGNKEKATEIVLNNELLLMKELNFHLTVHNPFRALEGLIIDVKARHVTVSHSKRCVLAALCSTVRTCNNPSFCVVQARCQSLRDPEALRGDIDKFLDEMLFTDAVLIFAPSQIALAAVSGESRLV